MTASSATSNGSLGSIVRVSPAEWKQPVPLDMFEEQLRTRDLALEYRILRWAGLQQRQRMLGTGPVTCERGEEGKDRYRDIIPFKDTRAHVGRAEHDRYINASYIRGSSSASNRDGGFIAAQAPLQSTALDFWSMILHHGRESGEQHVLGLSHKRTSVRRSAARLYLYFVNYEKVVEVNVHSTGRRRWEQ
ncbi:hypothetical protein FOZ62_026778, partial [Perkinsus olseni]